MIPADGRVAMLAIKENLLLRVVVNIVFFLPQRATRVEDALSLLSSDCCLSAVNTANCNQNKHQSFGTACTYGLIHFEDPRGLTVFRNAGEQS